ncbi:hypothetical protein EX895_002292 [Sporisorium graminicola]|uniref:Uncharacterized protein n=1 Tax=Sporisorium graminicola TaxID=280036 RepID=A0A4U7KVK2_9BASI|nr:hypothetical protein EX895_002292 [Sporisorium graminicola]TKY88661.1 hypothetical protein EX895_002292 [Sporisorium graminicola]
MSRVNSSSDALAEASGHRQARDPEASEASYASTLTDGHDDNFNGPWQSEASTVEVLGDGVKSSSSTWPDHQYSDNPPSSSIKAVGSSKSLHKGKQPSDGHYSDRDHQKLGTIDETFAASASSYAAQNSYSSSANGYAPEDAKRLYQDRGHVDSPDLDAALYSPSTYPPTSEEDSEAKRVQQNLERWAAEERQRRKAHRTSKLVSNRNSAISGGGGLANRLSILRSTGFAGNTNNLGAGPSSERLADGSGVSPSMSHTASLGDRRRPDATARQESASSTKGGAARGLLRPASPSSLDSAGSFGSLVSDDHRPNRKLPPIGSRVASATHDRHVSGGSLASVDGLGQHANGSARDPFRDPSEGGTADASSHNPRKRSSLKPVPTAFRPIVTVGRASSIQRQTLEASYASNKGKGKGRSMPTIVATDTEVEEDEDELTSDFDRSRDSQNPFASSQDSQRRTRTTSTTLHQGGLDEEVAMELAGRNKGLHNNGDLGEGTLGTDGEARPPPARTSTSSSKFRELGITEDDDWIETVGRNMGRERNSTKNMRIAHHASDDDDEREGARKPWWTDLLCGCSRDFDDDEQAGRTNPME